MGTALVVKNGNGASGDAAIIEAVVVKGDLAKFTPGERVAYYNAVCRSVGLNPLTRPFEYISLSGKLTLYARKDATEQLRKIHNVSVGQPSIVIADGLVTVTVQVSLPNGRTDGDVGVVTIENLRGEAKANAVMKAITKAKRRATLSICGLGWLDETEVETIGTPVVVNDTGEIVDSGPKWVAPVADEDAPVWAAWKKPDDAFAYAAQFGLERDEARDLLALVRDEHGGKLNRDTMPAIFALFVGAVDDVAESKYDAAEWGQDDHE